MKNLPKEIYLDIGCDASSEDDFNDLKQVTWSKDNATGYGVKYVLASRLKEKDEIDIVDLVRWVSGELEPVKIISIENAESMIEEYKKSISKNK